MSIIELLGIPDYWVELLLAVAAYVVLPIPLIGTPVCLPMLSRSRMLRFLLLAFAAMGSSGFFSSSWQASILLGRVLPHRHLPLFTISGLLLIKPVSPPSRVIAWRSPAETKLPDFRLAGRPPYWFQAHMDASEAIHA